VRNPDGGMEIQGCDVEIVTISFLRLCLPSHAYPRLQKLSRFFLLSSSTKSWAGRRVTLVPCISATSPLRLESETNCATPFVKVDMGVIIIFLKRSLLGAIFVTEKREVSPMAWLCARLDGVGPRSPRTAGANALICMFCRSITGAVERTRPMTPALLAAYNGDTGNGYKPALLAVQMMEPREGPSNTFLLM
jgi:hypothetical protein